MYVERQAVLREALAVAVCLRAAHGVGEGALDALKLAGQVVGVVHEALRGAAHKAGAPHAHDGLRQALGGITAGGVHEDAGNLGGVGVGRDALVLEGRGERLGQLRQLQALGHHVCGALAGKHLVGLGADVGKQLVGELEVVAVQAGADALDVVSEDLGVVLGVHAHKLGVAHQVARGCLFVHQEGEEFQVGPRVSCLARAAAQVEDELVAAPGQGRADLGCNLGHLAGIVERVDAGDDACPLDAARALGLGRLDGVFAQVEAHDVAVAGKDVDVVEHAHGQVPVLAVGVAAPEDLGPGVLEEEVYLVHPHGHDAHAGLEARLLGGLGHIEEALVALHTKAQVPLLVGGVVAGDLAASRVGAREVLARRQEELVHVGACVARRLCQGVPAGPRVADGEPAARRVHVQRLADGVVTRQIEKTSHARSFQLRRTPPRRLWGPPSTQSPSRLGLCGAGVPHRTCGSRARQAADDSKFVLALPKKGDAPSVRGASPNRSSLCYPIKCGQCRLRPPGPGTWQRSCRRRGRW